MYKNVSSTSSSCSCPINMVGSTRESPTNSITPVSSFEDLLTCSFINLELGHDEVGCNHANVSDQPNNVVLSATAGSSSNTSAEVSDDDTRSTRSSDDRSTNSAGHRQPQYSSLPSTDQNTNIWSYHYNPSYAGDSAMLWDWNSAMNVGLNVLGREYNYTVDNNPYFHPASRSNGGYLPNGYYTNGSRNQCVGNLSGPRPELFGSGDQVITWAKTEEGSKSLQSLLQLSGSYANMILEKVFDSMFELMIDEHGHHLFQRLVEVYTHRNQLELIVNKITLHPHSPVIVALHHYGSLSIQKLIKQLKKSSLALKMTQALSVEFYELMITRTGRNVIKQCFALLDYRTSEVLYEKAIRYCMALATHPQGCISLNDCIEFISGDQRRHLLRVISDNSVFLSYDPSGNFVVQHVLGLYNQEFTDNICTRLRGNYTQLSTMQTGSHVVEKCVRLSGEGMRYVVEELIKSNKLVELARDKFGNYVIQTALKTTKRVDTDLYRYLVRALQPHLSTLQHRKPGKYVVELIRDL